jgi:predicted peptidase
LTLGGDLFVKESVRNEFPSIVIFPQCSNHSFWSNVYRKQINGKEVFDYRTDGEPTKDMELLIKLIEQVEMSSYVDKSRVYLMGISMGGMGVFELLRRKKTFTAAVSICGGDTPDNADKFGRDLSMWIFHGANDKVVPADASRLMAEKLQALGNEVKLTIYPGVGHSSWENALKEKALLPWLFSKRMNEVINEKII